MNYENYFVNGSSPVNFCEPDLYYMNLGEFYNTITSFFILLAGIYGIYKLTKIDKNYLKKNLYINEITDSTLKIYKNHSFNLYSLLCFVGIGSIYFHSKLSEFSHWVDIIFISLILLLSDYYLNKIDNKLDKSYYIMLLIVHILSSIFAPSIHIFFLFITGINIKKKLNENLNRLENSIESSSFNKIEKKFNNISKLFLLSKLLWIIDYLGCEYINGYHLHWIFHILIAIISYKIIKLNLVFYFLIKNRQLNNI